MTYQPGSYQPPPADPAAQRQQVIAEIAWRQASIAGAETEIGRIVGAEIRSGRCAPATAEIDGELRRVLQSEYAIAQLQQAYAIESETAANLAVDPATQCPACRSGVMPHQRYCPACGEKLVRSQVAAPLPQQAGVPSGHHPQQPAAPPECARCGRPVDAGAAYCVSCGWRVGRSMVAWYRARWLRYGLLGLAVYVFCQAMLPHTDYAEALIVAELIIGAALVPVVFVSYFYERGTRDQTPLSVLVTTFGAGAILGCTAAVVLETAVHVHGDGGYLAVGFIEEGCKGAILYLWLRRRDLLAPDRGLVIGAATGMGFAALETMQYGMQSFLVTLFDHSGHIVPAVTAMIGELNVRGVLAPLGHGTWTGILAAVIWYERSAGRSVVSGRVWLAYLGVSLLHGLYDIAAGSQVGLVTLVSGARVSIFAILIGLLGFVALVGIVRAARRGRDPVAAFFESPTRGGRAERQSQQWPPSS